MGHTAEHPTDHQLLPPRYRSLLMIAVLAGMATAAAFVLLQSMRSLSDPLHAPVSAPAVKPTKPSVFGNAPIGARTAPDVKMSAAQIAKAGNRSIVTVIGYDPNDQPIAQGVGYVYSDTGFIVTTYAAIRGATSVVVETTTGDQLSVIALMGYSPTQDLAVLAVLEGNLPALETGPAEIVQEGDPVVALGLGNAVSEGLVGPRRAMGGVDLIQITATASAGTPVLSQHGKVIGLATRRRVGTETLTLAIPSHYIQDLLAEHRVLSFEQMREETR